MKDIKKERKKERKREKINNLRMKEEWRERRKENK
jgi:hypothetical protein